MIRQDLIIVLRIPACACLRNELALRRKSRVVASRRSGSAGMGDDEGR